MILAPFPRPSPFPATEIRYRNFPRTLFGQRLLNHHLGRIMAPLGFSEDRIEEARILYAEVCTNILDYDPGGGMLRFHHWTLGRHHYQALISNRHRGLPVERIRLRGPYALGGPRRGWGHTLVARLSQGAAYLSPEERTDLLLVFDRGIEHAA